MVLDACEKILNGSKFWVEREFSRPGEGMKFGGGEEKIFEFFFVRGRKEIYSEWPELTDVI